MLGDIQLYRQFPAMSQQVPITYNYKVKMFGCANYLFCNTQHEVWALCRHPPTGGKYNYRFRWQAKLC